MNDYNIILAVCFNIYQEQNNTSLFKSHTLLKDIGITGKIWGPKIN